MRDRSAGPRTGLAGAGVGCGKMGGHVMMTTRQRQVWAVILAVVIVSAVLLVLYGVVTLGTGGK